MCDRIQLRSSGALHRNTWTLRKRLWLRWVGLLVFVLAQSSIRVLAVSAQESPLQLEEARDFVVPDTMDIMGAAPLSDGTVWLWTRSTGAIYKWASGQEALSAFPFEGRVISATGTAVPRELEVVEGLRPSISILNDRGIRAHHAVPLVLALDAMPDSQGWFIIGADSLGAIRLLRCESESCHAVRARLPDGLVKEHLVRLARVGSTPVLMDVDDPFRFVRFDGTTYASSTSREIRGLLATVQKSGRWVALSPIAVGAECILEFADLRSDTRVVLALDQHARVLRHTVLNVPLGFMAVQPERKTVIAARRGAQLELVEYRYAR